MGEREERRMGGVKEERGRAEGEVRMWEGRRALEPWSLRHQSVMDVRHRTATRPDRD